MQLHARLNGSRLDTVKLLGSVKQTLGQCKPKCKIFQICGTGHHDRMRNAVEDHCHRDLLCNEILPQLVMLRCETRDHKLADPSWKYLNRVGHHLLRVSACWASVLGNKSI